MCVCKVRNSLLVHEKSGLDVLFNDGVRMKFGERTQFRTQSNPGTHSFQLTVSSSHYPVPHTASVPQHIMTIPKQSDNNELQYDDDDDDVTACNKRIDTLARLTAATQDHQQAAVAYRDVLKRKATLQKDKNGIMMRKDVTRAICNKIEQELIRIGDNNKATFPANSSSCRTVQCLFTLNHFSQQAQQSMMKKWMMKTMM